MNGDGNGWSECSGTTEPQPVSQAGDAAGWTYAGRTAGGGHLWVGSAGQMFDDSKLFALVPPLDSPPAARFHDLVLRVGRLVGRLGLWGRRGQWVELGATNDDQEV